MNHDSNDIHLLLETMSAFPPVMSVQEVGELLGVSEKTIYGLVHRNMLFALKVGRSHRIPKVSVANYLIGQGHGQMQSMSI